MVVPISSLLGIPVIVSDKRNKPIIELRKPIEDYETIKAIITCAFHDRPILILPKFTNREKSIASLIQKGIIFLDEDMQYKFVH